MIYQLRIELKDSSPTIWRRIQVEGETSFSELHHIIQLSMGWGNDHLYEFTVKNVRVFDFQDKFDNGSDPSERDSMDTSLDKLVVGTKTRFTYLYDFGDSWEHAIQLEKILPLEEGKRYPVCLGGEGACPPEDCGGIWGYYDKLRILADAEDPEHDEISEWMGRSWDAEVFDVKRVNSLLQSYARQWEEIYEETDKIIDNLERNGGPDEDWDVASDDADDEGEYYALKKFSCPEDVLEDENERSEMKFWLKTALDEPKSVECQTSERLRNLGFDEGTVNELMLQALSIEWYYYLKHGTGHLHSRYAFNLHRLPEAPVEFPQLEDALAVLDSCVKGIPFAAIEYLQNSTSVEAVSAIIQALRNHSYHQYCWGNCTLAPFWYALAAEGHLCEELIDPVVQLYRENFRTSEWLFDQGQYLVGKLAQKYPYLAASKVLEAMEKDAADDSIPYVFYLFDAFHFCDINEFKPRLLALLERDDLFWNDMFAGTIADLQIKEGLPVLNRHLKKLRAGHSNESQLRGSIADIEEAIKILQGELPNERLKPLCLERVGSWRSELEALEHFFYEGGGSSGDFRFSDPAARRPAEQIAWPALTVSKPIIKEKTPGRNDPCHCGSGKKYKKCCLDKDSQGR